LTFSSFDLESPCDSDFVEVKDVPVGTSKGKFCGNFPDTVSAAEEVMVRFVTGPSGRRKGFLMQYVVNKGMTDPNTFISVASKCNLSATR